MIGDDKTPLQVKVTPVGFIVYVASYPVWYLTQTLTFIYEVIGNVCHITTIGIMNNIVCVFAQFLQAAETAEKFR